METIEEALSSILSLLENLHVLLGFAAVALVFLPLLSKKGGKLHVRSGRFFVYSMTFIGFSALILASFTVMSSEPGFEDRFHAAFQIFLGIFLLAAIQQGTHVFRHKVRKKRVISLRTVGLPVLLLFSSLMMIGFGFKMRFLHLFMGASALVVGGVQLCFWVRPQRNRRDWWNFHLMNMFVSTTLSLVAFNLEVVSRVFDFSIREMPLWIWISPAYFMMPWMFWELRKHQK